APPLHTVSTALLVLSRGAHVLLLRCWDPRRRHRTYGLIGAELDGSEPAIPCLARCALDEVGIVVVPDDVTLVHVLHRRADVQRVDLFFASRVWAGEPSIRAPERCDDLRWADIGQLPSDTAGHIRAGLDGVQRGHLFSPLGWTPT
ncbi:MAG: NUDIX domain-containing protein, partial [Candidatus Rokuibacteriota bacterium]